MTTLTYGYKLPQTGDFGSGATGWFPALEFDIQRINDHDHDGLNSKPLSSKAISPEKVSVLAGAFTNISPGINRTTITNPAGMQTDNIVLVVKDQTTKEIIFAKTEKFSVTQSYIYLAVPVNIEVVFLT